LRPGKDAGLTAREIVHHLIPCARCVGEGPAPELGVKVEVVRELAYRLYTLCERKKRARPMRSSARPELARDRRLACVKAEGRRKTTLKKRTKYDRISSFLILPSTFPSPLAV